MNLVTHLVSQTGQDRHAARRSHFLSSRRAEPDCVWHKRLITISLARSRALGAKPRGPISRVRGSWGKADGMLISKPNDHDHRESSSTDSLVAVRADVLLADPEVHPRVQILRLFCPSVASIYRVLND